MGKDKLDRTVKSKLYDLHTPIDTNDLWAGIESKMDQDNPSPTPGFSFRKYLGLGILAVLLMGTLYVGQSYMTSDTQDLTESINTGNISSELNSDLASANIANAPKQSNASVDNTNLNSIKTGETDNTRNSITSSNESAPNNIAITRTSNSNTTLNSNTTSKTNTTSQLKNNTTTNTKKSAAKAKEKNSYTSGLADNKTSAEKSVSERPDQGQVAAGGSTGNIGTGGTSTNNIYESAQNNNAQNAIGAFTEKAEKIVTNSATKETSSNLIMASLQALNHAPSLNYAKDDRDVCDALKGDACSGALRLRNRVDCYDNWTADRSKFSILPYVGIDLVTNDRSRTDTAEPDEYLITRQSTMQFLEVLKAGALIKYNLNPNVYVKAGVEYDQIREKFESTLVTQDQIFDPETIIAYRIDMEGDTIPVLGPGTMQVIRTTVWKKYNKYHSFNIPIIIGYEAPISKRWDYFGEAGIFYNVRFSYEGTLLDTNNEVVSGENFFLNQTGVSLYGGAGARFNINKRWSVFTNASYKYNLASINNQDFNPIRQNLGLAGISIGAEIRL